MNKLNTLWKYLNVSECIVYPVCKEFRLTSCELRNNYENTRGTFNQLYVFDERPQVFKIAFTKNTDIANFTVQMFPWQ